MGHGQILKLSKGDIVFGIYLEVVKNEGFFLLTASEF